MPTCPHCHRDYHVARSGLTPKQKQTMDFIRSYIHEHGYSPSYDEMRAVLGLKSKSGVHRIVYALMERGWIDFSRDRARSIAIMPEAA